MSVGIFDSGLGGLTVYRAVAERLPDLPVVYYGDNAHTPYGVRDADGVDRAHRAPHPVQQQVEVVDHEIQHHVHVRMGLAPVVPAGHPGTEKFQLITIFHTLSPSTIPLRGSKHLPGPAVPSRH